MSEPKMISIAEVGRRKNFARYAEKSKQHATASRIFKSVKVC